MSAWRFDTSGPILLDLGIGSGRVEVDVADDDVVEVSADDPERITVDWSGSTLTIRQPQRVATGRVRVRVSLPAGSDVDVSVGAADVFVGSGCDDVSVKGGSGDVRVGDARRVRVAAASGDIRIASVAEDLSVSGASGDVMIGAVGGDVEVSVASGDVRVERIGGGADISSAAGDVRVQRFEGSSIGIKSLSGDVQIGLPSGIRVEADMKTITGQISIPERNADSPPPQRTVRLQARTMSGDIRVERA